MADQGDKQKFFVGSGWKHEFQNGGSVLNFLFKKSELARIPVDDNGNIAITIAKVRGEKKTERSPDYYATDDEYKTEKLGGLLPAYSSGDSPRNQARPAAQADDDYTF